ncbi:MAG: phosphatase PAP2 family protein [Eubacterium sp.]|nr:phosphatase PAP2 family protein [Eubacterium sp.]
MYKWLKKYLDPVVPLFSIIPLLTCFGVNMLIYTGALILSEDWTHYDLTTAYDRNIPLVPEWLSIYFGCYIFWIGNYILTAHINRDNAENFYKFISTDILSRLVCLCFYTALPTIYTRPEIVGNGFWEKGMRFLYNLDAPSNLFPSIHVLVSWLCFVGIRKSDQIPKLYKVFSALMAIAVWASTLFTKQHYIIDGAAGILLAELLYFLNQKTSLYKLLKSFFQYINYLCFRFTKGEYADAAN